MTILLMLQLLLGNFVQKWYIPQGIDWGAGRLLIADTDRDNNYELIFSTYAGPFTIYFYELHLPDTWVVDSVSDLNAPILWDIGDFDLDGLYDLVLQCGSTNPYWVGIAIFESPNPFSYPTQEVWRDTVGFALVQPISAYDVDNDGFPELLDNNGNGQPHYFWMFERISDNLYDTVFTTNPDTTLLDAPTSTHAFGDFDNDGKNEFVMGGLSAGIQGATYWIYESSANNTYEQIIQDYVPTKNIKDCFSVPDADGDGRLEFVVKGFVIPTAEIHAFIFEATGDNTYEIIKTFTLPGGDYYGGYSDVGDVDGDSIPEIALEGRQTVYIIKAAGNDSFYVWETLPGHVGGSCVRVFDLDGNGLSEVIISGNNETRIYEYEVGVAENTPSEIWAICLSVSPNPFRNQTVIKYAIQDSRHWTQNPTLKIYDTGGRLIKTFRLPSSSENQESSVTWYGDDDYGKVVPQGVYFARIEHPEITQTYCKKVILMR
jgi:hypothetical protein